jgi:CRP-like cAMP-binding protein
MKEARYEKDADIIRQGDIGDKFYVIAEGRANIIIDSDNGTRVAASMETGGFFGEVALLKDQPRNATVRASEPVVAYTLSKIDFLAAVKAHKSFEDQMGSSLFSRG